MKQNFYGPRARAQRERQHFQDLVPNFDKSDREGDSNEDELPNIDEDESVYSLSSTEESGNDSEEKGAEVNCGADSESAVEKSSTAESYGSSKSTQSMRWHKRQPMQYDVTYKGEPFPPHPLEEHTPLQHFKKFFDDALIDHFVEQTNPFSVQSTGTSIGVSHNEMEMYFGLLVIMSIIKLPQIRMYWSKETRAPFMVDVTAINRFEKIKVFSL